MLVTCPECGRRQAVEFANLSIRPAVESRTVVCAPCGTTFSVECRETVAYELRTTVIGKTKKAGNPRRKG